VIFDLDLDASGGNPSLKVKTLETLKTILTDMDLCDIWRVRNPDSKRYTWSGVAQGRSTIRDKRLFRRLDYLFISDSLQPFIDKAMIIPAPSTDHSATSITLSSFDEGRRGPSFWKLNNSLLKEEKFINETNKLIDSVITNLKDDNIISPQRIWELIKYELR